MELDAQIAVGYMIEDVGNFINIPLVIDQLPDGEVKGLCKFSHLVSGMNGEFHIEVAVGNPLCGVGNFFNRL